jgi:Tol biopolymer transport system component
LRDEPLWARDETALYFVAPTEGTIGEGADQKWSFYRLDLSKGSYVKVGKVETAGLVRMAGTTTDSIIYLLNTYGKTPTGSIFSLDVSSGKTSQLYHIENNNLFDAALSPDRSKIALVINEADGSRGLHVLARGQKTPSFITAIRPNARAQLMWLSSGDAIITSGRIKGNQGIWRIPLDGTQPQSLNIPATDVTEVRVSADGRKIAFTRTSQLPRQILALAASP